MNNVVAYTVAAFGGSHLRMHGYMHAACCLLRLALKHAAVHASARDLYAVELPESE